jgi:signal transduction histidine kinase
VLTASRWPIREWLLFAAGALVPTVAISVLALGALESSDTAVRREVAASLDASAARVSRAVEQQLAESEGELGRAAFDGDGDAIEARLRPVVPGFVDAIVLDRRGELVRPAETSPAAAPPECGPLVDRLASPASDDRTRAVGAIVASCEEACTPRGDRVWPLVVLDILRTSPDAALSTRLDAWIASHARQIPDVERRALAADFDRAAGLADDERLRLKASLAASPLPTDSLQSALREAEATRAVRAADDPKEVSSWRAAHSRGAVRLFPSGLLAGFVVSAASLARGAPALVSNEAGVRARVVEGGVAARGSLVRVTAGLALAIENADPGAVERRASTSRNTLIAAAGASCLVAIGFAWILFARMLSARRSSALRVDFAAAVSHELRTPIATVRMMAELLDEERVPEDERDEVQKTLARDARRLGDIVDRLLAFSRLASGRGRAPRTESRVGDLLAASIDQLEARQPEVPPVERNFDRDLSFPVDAAQLTLALDNLLANAAKHAPLGGPYRVDATADATTLTVSVTDRGPGVARGNRRRIFRPFERVEDRLNRTTEGAGIGLALVAEVARAHGGRAWVEGNVGEGARFVVTLPRGS